MRGMVKEAWVRLSLLEASRNEALTIVTRPLVCCIQCSIHGFAEEPNNTWLPSTTVLWRKVDEDVSLCIRIEMGPRDVSYMTRIGS